MKMHEVTYSDAIPFDGYGPGFFRLAGKVHEGDLLVTASTVAAWGGYDDAAAVLAISEEIDVVLVGTGPDMAHIPAAFREKLEEAGIGVETMATASACRTYNILLAEGRRVAAAVLAL
jgi:uncharacterized protein